jgi:hypothetical protein
MLVRRGEKSETSDEKMRELYENHLWKVKYLIKHNPYLEMLNINYKDVLEDPGTQAKRIVEFTGLGLDAAKMAAVVDAQLYRNRAAS